MEVECVGEGMAERKATNKYYPPSWDPSKGSINRFVGQHPLRARAAKASLGIIVVRFEMPFNVWCLSCEKHIGQGTRYNAEKKKIGYYFSTPIYAFKMTCHLCSGKIEIHTDPKLGEYILKDGLRKRVEEFSAKDAETIDLIDDKTREKMEADPFYKLEHGLNLKEKAEETEQVLEKIISLNDEQWADPWAVSQKLRKNFRQEKKRRIDHQSKESDFLDKNGLNLKLLPPVENDEETAKSVSFSGKDINEIRKRSVLSRSIFSKSFDDQPSEFNDVINRHKIKVDNFLSIGTSVENTKDKSKLVTKDYSIKKSLKLLAHYSSDGSD